MTSRFTAMLCAVLVLFGSGVATAIVHEECRSHQRSLDLLLRTSSEESKRAADREFPDVVEAVRRDGPDNPRKTRDDLIRSADENLQNLIVQRMQIEYCEMIWSRAALSDSDKDTRVDAVIQDLRQRARYARTSLARTQDSPRQQSRRAVRQVFLVHASANAAAPLRLAQNDPDPEPSEPNTGFLRDVPFYINDTNKWFVIVASPASKEEGIRTMNKLKSIAPQYNFELYAPYGDNPYYAVMMATWVSKTVADKVRKLAQRDLMIDDAFYWRCPSSGDTC